jgi:hypothetical protein
MSQEDLADLQAALLGSHVQCCRKVKVYIIQHLHETSFFHYYYFFKTKQKRKKNK